MNTQENNKSIAEFMGLNIDNGVQSDYMEHELKYHKSWDWLMPVVEKMNTTELWDEYDISHLATYLVSVDRNATYNAVVEFINQYNK